MQVKSQDNSSFLCAHFLVAELVLMYAYCCLSKIKLNITVSWTMHNLSMGDGDSNHNCSEHDKHLSLTFTVIKNDKSKILCRLCCHHCSDNQTAFICEGVTHRHHHTLKINGNVQQTKIIRLINYLAFCTSFCNSFVPPYNYSVLL